MGSSFTIRNSCFSSQRSALSILLARKEKQVPPRGVKSSVGMTIMKN